MLLVLACNDKGDDLKDPSALCVYWQSNAVFYEDFSYLDLSLLN